MSRNDLDRVRFGPYEADLRTHELWKHGIRVKLVGQPFEILEVLLRRPGEMVTREELRERLWPGDTFVDFNHGLNAAVNKLRDALSDSADDPRYIETLPRRGYRFLGKVEWVTPAAAEASVNVVARPVVVAGDGAASQLSASSPGPVEPCAETPIHPAARIGRLAWKIAVGLLVGLLFMLLIFGAIAYRAVQRHEHTTSVAYSPSGVLALSNSPGSASEPALSADGTQVAFRLTSYEGDQSGLYVKRIGSSDAGGGISLVDVNTRQTRQVTQPSAQEVDTRPAFSPDGTMLTFVRSQVSEFPQDIYVVPTAGGEARKLTSEHAQILGRPAWAADGQSIVFASTRNGEAGLWRVSIKGDEPQWLEQAGRLAWNPAIARRGERLAFQQILNGTNIWRLDLNDPGKARVRVTTAKGKNEGAQISPDGKQMTFMSNGGVTERTEIWVAGSDGSNLVQKTALNGAGTPRWSPDGKTLAFDTQVKGRGAIFTMAAEGGIPRPLVQDGSEDLVPSWSRDGQWVYFASNRSGDWQVWKVRAVGGVPVRVTVQGGFAAYESPDGDFLYYAKSRYPRPELWRVPTSGGPETPVSGAVRPATWADWAVTEKGIYFIEENEQGSPTLTYFDLAQRTVTQVARLEKFPFWLCISADGRWAYYDQADAEDSNIVVVDSFR